MRKEEGQDLVEFALIAPLLFLLLLGIMEFGVAVWQYNTVANAAREGARASVMFGMAGRESSAISAACQFMNGLGIRCDVATLGPTSNPTVMHGTTRFILDETSGACRLLEAVTVTYEYHGVTGLTQLITPDGIRLVANSSMLREDLACP